MKARLLLNLGNVYEHQKLYDKAQLYFRRSIELSEKFELFDTCLQSYHALGSLYAKQGETSNAMTALLEAENVAERLTTDRVPKLTGILISMSEIFVDMADYKSAKQYLVKAYKLKNPNPNEREQIETTLKIGKPLSTHLVEKVKL